MLVLRSPRTQRISWLFKSLYLFAASGLLAPAVQAGPVDSCDPESTQRTLPLKDADLPWSALPEQNYRCQVSVYPAIGKRKPASRTLEVTSQDHSEKTQNFGKILEEHNQSSGSTWLELQGLMIGTPSKQRAVFSLVRRGKPGSPFASVKTIGKTPEIQGKGTATTYIETYRVHVSCILVRSNGSPVDGRGGG